MGRWVFRLRRVYEKCTVGGFSPQATAFTIQYMHPPLILGCYKNLNLTSTWLYISGALILFSILIKMNGFNSDLNGMILCRIPTSSYTGFSHTFVTVGGLISVGIMQFQDLSCWKNHARLQWDSVHRECFVFPTQSMVHVSSCSFTVGVHIRQRVLFALWKHLCWVQDTEATATPTMLLFLPLLLL